MYFEEPELEVVRFSPQDMLIATSGVQEGSDTEGAEGGNVLFGTSLNSSLASSAPKNNSLGI